MQKLTIYDVVVATKDCRWSGAVAAENAKQARKTAVKAAGIEYAILPKNVIEMRVAISENFEVWVQS